MELHCFLQLLHTLSNLLGFLLHTWYQKAQSMALLSMTLYGLKYFIQGIKHMSRWKASLFSRSMPQEDFSRESLKTPSSRKSTLPTKPSLFQDSAYAK